MTIDYTSIGRHDLEVEHAAMLANLTTTQERCTELLLENRDLKRRSREDTERRLALDEYQALALRTSSSPNAVLEVPTGPYELLQIRERLLQSALGVAGEAGEVADYIKKVAFHGHTLDHAKLMKELGDVLWYIAEMSSAIGARMSDVGQVNVDKLRERYPDGFITTASINRVEGA